MRKEITEKAVSEMIDGILKATVKYSDKMAQVHIELFAEGFKKIIDREIQGSANRIAKEAFERTKKHIDLCVECYKEANEEDKNE